MKKMQRGLLATLLAATAPLAFAVEYVDKDATGGSNTGGSWANAFTSLDAALDSGTDDEVWVAEGTYTSAQAQGFQLRNHSLYGGFDGTESARDQRDPAAHRTILNGSGTKRVLNKAAASTGTAVVDGFTVKDGATTGMGAGLSAVDGIVAIANCVFTNNVATQNGGAVYVSSAADGALTIRDSVFHGNQSTSASYNGGDVNAANFAFDVTISNCTFAASRSGNYGGSLYLYNTGDCSIQDCTFDDVAGANSGGAIFRSSSTVVVNTLERLTFRNTTITAGASGSPAGGAVYLTGAAGSRHALTACAFVNVANLRTGSNCHGGAVMVYAGIAEFVGCNFTNVTISSGAITSAGGAIYVSSATVDPVTISNCTFKATTNSLQGTGGAVHIVGRTAPVLIVDSTFHACTSGRDGGAVFLVAAAYPRVIERCSFLANKVLADTYDGGALYVGNSATGSRVVNCVFAGNSAPDRGGAVYQPLGSLDYLHCTFHGNTGGSGGALYVLGTANVTNTIFRGNSGGAGNEELNASIGATLNLDHCNGDTARMANEDSATNMENADPLYLNAAGFDFRIPMNSPMKNRGIALANVTIDRAKSARAGLPDIGAYETPRAPRGTTIIAR